MSVARKMPVEYNAGPIETRVAPLDWAALAADLDAHGCAVTGPLLNAGECAALARAMTPMPPSAAVW